jgi:uncharacterized membrane-anchored protein
MTNQLSKKAQLKQAETKHNSALLLSIMSAGLLIYSLTMMCLTSDIDYVILFNIASLALIIGVMGLKK